MHIPIRICVSVPLADPLRGPCVKVVLCAELAHRALLLLTVESSHIANPGTRAFGRADDEDETALQAALNERVAELGSSVQAPTDGGSGGGTALADANLSASLNRRLQELRGAEWIDEAAGGESGALTGEDGC